MLAPDPVAPPHGPPASSTPDLESRGGGGVKIRDNMCTGIDHNQSQGVYELARECVVGSRSMNPAKGIGDLFVLTCYMRVRNPDSIIGLKHPYGSRAFGQDRILSAT